MKTCTKKKIIIGVLCFIVVVLYAVAVYRVNKNTPVVKYKIIEKGDELKYKNYSSVIEDCNVYDLSNIRQMYNIEEYDYKAPLEDEHVKCILVEAVITKNYDWTDDADYEFMVTEGTLGTDIWSVSASDELFTLINPDYNVYEAKSGESYEVTIPFIALDIHYPENMWNDLLGEPTYIVYYYNKEFGGIPKLMIN